MDIKNAASPGLPRRLAAMFYDSWLLVALWLIGATADVFLRNLLGADEHSSHLLLQLYLLACPFLFYGWFWTHGGQTLGMRAWRLRLLDTEGSPVTWRKALLRAAGALISLSCLGLGYLWILVDREQLAWHDHWSGTRLVMVSKQR